MQDRIRELGDNLKEKWQGLERGQKLRLGLGVVCLVIALAVTLYFAFRPEWVVLYNNKDITTLSKARTVLNDANIKFNISDDSTSLSVLKKDEFTARAALNESPEIEGDLSFVSEDIFDKAGFGVSESVKKTMNKVAMQNELANSIKKMAGVSDATVFLNIPDNSSILFKDAVPASASIFITQSSDIDSAKAQAIADHVATAVSGLDKKNITITNQNMVVLFSGDSQGAGSLNADYEIELKRKNEIDSKVFMAVKPFFDDVKVISNIAVNTDKKEAEIYEVTPLTPDTDRGVVSEQSKLNETAETTAEGGEPGLGSNNQTTGTYEMTDGGGGSSATRKEDKTIYDHSKSTTYIQDSYGDLIPADSSLSVTGYRFKFYDQKYMQDNNMLGDLSWAEFKEEKTTQMPVRVEVDEGILQSIQFGTGIENVSLVAYELYYFQDIEAVPVDWQLIVVFVILALLIVMLAVGLFRSAQPEEVLEVDPELSVEDLLVSTQLEEEKEEEVERLKDIDYSTDSEVKKQIDKFVEDKPEAVAQLLRNWLNEGWE
ncbi:flagellar M-ring protein FliF [Tyzzerella sp. OttesenSCG-928-J15]|nr:flagellar M-ring protein FliF [Tyzzerella sp. OttesenSCG-928-J15]